MLLPPCYQDIDTYFHEVLNFLNDYQWLYNVPVTEILIHNILDRIPQDWARALLALDNFELNHLPYGLIKEWWPQSLLGFCKHCQNLQLPIRVFQDDHIGSNELPSKLCRGLTIKKKHEVTRLAAFIHEECRSKSITNILDVGSGLGYLGQVLHHRYGYRVVGLESQSQLVKTAVQCQRTLCPTVGTVSYFTCNISHDSTSTIQQCLEEQMPLGQELLNCHCQSDSHGSAQKHSTDDTTVCFKENSKLSIPMNSITHNNPDNNVIDNESFVQTIQEKLSGTLKSNTECCWSHLNDEVHSKTVSSSDRGRICMVGLHTCGDLSACVSELFLKLACLRLFIIIPCCYHKMSLSYIEPNSTIDTCLQTITGAKMKLFVKESANDTGVVPERFTYFPQSHALKRQVAEFPSDVGLFLRRPFLRLASQETSVRWRHCSKEVHEEHSMQLMARALLYLYAHKENLKLKKKRRRGVRKTQLSTFSGILEDILQRYDFIGKSDSLSILDIQCELTKLWNEYRNLCQLAEVLTGLQVALQAVVESFVLVDRMVYLQENEEQLLSYDIVKVMDDQISPRCHALVARK